MTSRDLNFKDSVIKPMIFGNVVIDETFGLVQNEHSMDETTSREFSFTAPVSGFYRFQVNLQQITQVGFQDFYIASCSHRPIVYLWAIDYLPHSLWVIELILWTHKVKIILKNLLSQQHIHTNTSTLAF